jgi:hypothetical protein
MSKKKLFEVTLNDPVSLTQNLENYIKEVSNIKNQIVNNNILYSPGQYYKNSVPAVSPIKTKKKCMMYFERFLEKNIKKILDKKISNNKGLIKSEYNSPKKANSPGILNLFGIKLKSETTIPPMTNFTLPKTSILLKKQTLSNRSCTSERKTISDFNSFKQSRLNLYKHNAVKENMTTKPTTAFSNCIKLSLFKSENSEKTVNIINTLPETNYNLVRLSTPKYSYEDNRSINKLISFLPKMIKHSEFINKELKDCSKRYNRKNYCK